MILTTTIEVIMGRCLPDEVVHRIRIHIEAGEAVPAVGHGGSFTTVVRRVLFRIRFRLY